MEVSEIFDLITGKILNWVETLIHMLPNLIIVILLLFIGYYLARWLKKKSRNFMFKLTKIDIVSNLFSSFVFFLIIAIVIFTALKILNLDKALTTALAGAGIISLALAFAFQDIAANFVSGVFISIRLPFRIGHLIKIEDTIGTVKQITLRDTVVRTFHGQNVVVPNKKIFDSPLVNYTSSNKRCIDLKVGVSYGDELPDVKKITLNALKEIEDRMDEQGILFYYEEFGDSSIDFFVRLWLKETKQAFYLETRSQAIMIIKKTFDEHDLNMPFPIRTLDFDVHGGKNLSEVDLKVNKN